MESTLIVSSVNPPKKDQMSLFHGGGRDGENSSLFFFFLNLPGKNENNYDLEKGAILLGFLIQSKICSK